MMVDGHFTVPLQPQIDDTLVAHLFHNCFMMVYGAMRGYLNLLTAVIQGTFIVLPGIDLMAVRKRSKQPT